ncbi:MAG: DUF2971 domain-containing protein [Alphaproteobacteria bacterium]|nr:DUF2971 domain-containing protein [Alphaproteobacteria bacterium]
MIPKYVYHYTSLSTLREIINSGNIRFTRLDLLNDPYEGIHTIDCNMDYNSDSRKLIYCSCWTDCSEESISMWSVYGDMKGTRIKIKSNMFSEKFFVHECAIGFVPVSKVEQIETSVIGNVKANIKEIFGPYKINYVETVEETYDNVLQKSLANKGSANEFLFNKIQLYELGMKKIKHWEYEKEWRYKICPFSGVAGDNQAFQQLTNINTLEHIDIPFINPIEEIILGPKCTDDDYEELKKFLSDKSINILPQKSKIVFR